MTRITYSAVFRATTLAALGLACSSPTSDPSRDPGAGGASAGSGNPGSGGNPVGGASASGGSGTSGSGVTAGVGGGAAGSINGSGGSLSGSGGSISGSGSGGVATGGTAGTGTGGDPGFPGPVVAFPGAEGFGKDALGGRGGSVCHVTTLADSGAGSLRDCVSQSNRTVVFDVGGWITLSSNLGITQNNITIAGQTAPGSGIGIRGRKFSIGGSDIVLRFLRVRRGIGTTTDRDDAMTVSSDAEDVIVDHCSVSYGTDETLSMPGDQGIGPRNLTVQWSIIAWGLQRNNHSAGSLFTSNQTTIHHTLWAFNKTRNPRCRSEEAANRQLGGHLDWVNNVVYGWNAPDPVGESMGWSISHDPFILAGTSNGQHRANAVGNYFISTRSASYAFHDGTSNFSLYFENNLLDGNANGTLDSSKTDASMVQGTPTMLGARIASPQVMTQSPAEAYALVMANVGATRPLRDEPDSVLISLVESQSGILIQDERDLMAEGVGDNGYGILPEETRPPGFDSDGDGMPDSWEAANGLNPSDPADGNADLNGDGYTNLEGYLAVLAQ